MDPPTEDPIDHFVLTSYLTKRHSIASNLSGDSNSLHEDFNGMLGDQPHKDKLMDQWYEGSTAEASDKLLLAAVKELPSTEEGSHLGWTQDDASRDTEDDDLEGSGLENAAMYGKWLSGSVKDLYEDRKDFEREIILTSRPQAREFNQFCMIG